MPEAALPDTVTRAQGRGQGLHTEPGAVGTPCPGLWEADICRLSVLTIKLTGANNTGTSLQL